MWQYRTYLSSLLRADFGQSLFMGSSAIRLVGERVPLTVQLALAGIAVAIAVSVPLGLMAATHRGGFWDLAATSLAVAGQAVPNFLLGLVLIVLFSVKWGVLPGSGAGSWRHLVLPAACLGMYLAPLNMRLIRSSVIDALEQDYIRSRIAFLDPASTGQVLIELVEPPRQRCSTACSRAGNAAATDPMQAVHPTKTG